MSDDELEALLEWVEQKERQAYTQQNANREPIESRYYDGYNDAWTEIARELDRRVRGEKEIDP